MHKIILRFYLVKDKSVFETIFDTRLSFFDNFRLLKEIYSINFNDDSYIIDPYRTIALRKDIILSEFNFKNFMTLYIY